MEDDSLRCLAPPVVSFSTFRLMELTSARGGMVPCRRVEACVSRTVRARQRGKGTARAGVLCAAAEGAVARARHQPAEHLVAEAEAAERSTWHRARFAVAKFR